MTNPAFDVVVVGAGPAGSLTACRLASLGYTVALIAAPHPPSAGRIEVLPPSLAALSGAVKLAPLWPDSVPALVTHLRWPGPEELVLAHPGTALVRRARFDLALADQARLEGVCVIGPARARRPRRMGTRWALTLAGPSVPAGITARFLVDATGRVSGFGGRRQALGPGTIALAASWTGATIAPGTVLVEAMAAGWGWGASMADGCLDTALFVDSSACAGLGRQALAQRAKAVLRAGAVFGPVLRHARQVASWMQDATPRAAANPVETGRVSVGDAVLSSDPLSSQGVQAAMRSALHGAAVVHTILAGGDEAAAMAFYRTSLQAQASRQRAVAGALYAQVPDAAGDFWRARAGQFIAAAPPALMGHSLLILSPQASIAARPALVGDRIAMVQAVHDPSEGRPVGWIGGFPAGKLLEDAGVARTATEILAAWSRTMPPEHAQTVLESCVIRGILKLA